MLVLFETPAGFALFKVLDEGKLNKVEDLNKDFSTAETARKVVKLKAFSKFENTSEALEAATLLIDSKPSKGLRKFLRVHCDGETLAVADSKLGNIIKEKLKIECVHNQPVMELMRGLRSQLSELISGLGVQDLAPMSLGLSHSLSRYKLKFSADKVDTMIIQAIGLLDDLDKELNTYAMRVREWYGWHFPELTKIIQDNILYAKTVKLMGDRVNAAQLDFSEILAEEVEIELKEAAMISMGTEVSDLDLINIKELCDQVLSLSEYRAQLYDYLKSRMNTIAPNLTALVGELVGARLIAHGGSLMNLAKQPGSTVQILGAEKALFRALKTKHATPKYGLIYHASLIGQAAPKNKGKISRSLAAKTALAVRCDALGDGQDNSMGLENRAKLEARLRKLEGKELGRSAGSAKGKPKIEVYDKDRKKGAGGLINAAKTYNPSVDSVLVQTLNAAAGNEEEKVTKKRKAEEAAEEALATVEDKKEKKKKEKKEKKKADEGDNGNDHAEPEHEEKEKKKKEKKEKKKKKADEGETAIPINGDNHAEPEGEEVVTKEKKKKRKHSAEVQNGDEIVDAGERKKKKRKHAEQEEESEVPSKKEKKKKKKSED
ncbi:probable nucleolar protein 5-1 [Quercus robur]|uniref:Nop domain-containing protein n=1 Tax=Quercus lobata TaxID=97700 RepID=A0A7N2L344_QUELO|nr:probable nucleolar protein 5-1 [Quercus lobata]XP_050274743.1 probable nucleolar protein 5-1 [Quercus robur]